MDTPPQDHSEPSSESSNEYRNESRNEPAPGDVLGLTRPLDGMEPGWYIILHIEDAAVQLCRCNHFPLKDDILPDRLRVTNVYNLCAFRRTGLRVPMESSRESV
jgi:hypothetical protein